jgi:hypothetical protein
MFVSALQPGGESLLTSLESKAEYGNLLLMPFRLEEI